MMKKKGKKTPIFGVEKADAENLLIQDFLNTNDHELITN